MPHLHKLVLEVSRRCNLTCRTCTSRPLRGPVLDASAFRNRMAGIRHGREIDLVRLVGDGESLLAPSFAELLESAAWICPGAEIEFFTNGMLLDEPLTRTLVDLDAPTTVTVSVDGASPAVFEHIRRGASFRRVVRNLERVRDLKRSAAARFPKVRINFSMLALNLDEIPDVMELAARLGADEVRYSQLVLHPRGELAVAEQHPFAPENRARTRERLLEALRISEHEDVGMVATWPQVLGWTERYPSAEDLARGLGTRLVREPCVWALSSLYVCLDGEVYPCCRRPLLLGRVREGEDLDGLFESETATDLRDRLLRDEEVPACAGCIWYRRDAFRLEGREHWVSEAMFGDGTRIR